MISQTKLKPKSQHYKNFIESTAHKFAYLEINETTNFFRQHSNIRAVKVVQIRVFLRVGDLIHIIFYFSFFLQKCFSDDNM